VAVFKREVVAWRNRMVLSFEENVRNTGVRVTVAKREVIYIRMAVIHYLA
jgi:hypothetical protein